MKAAVITLMVALYTSSQTFAQEVATDSLASGALQNPEDEGLPWTYIVMVLVLIAVFMLLRRNRTLPSKRRGHP